MESTQLLYVSRSWFFLCSIVSLSFFKTCYTTLLQFHFHCIQCSFESFNLSFSSAFISYTQRYFLNIDFSSFHLAHSIFFFQANACCLTDKNSSSLRFVSLNRVYAHHSCSSNDLILVWTQSYLSCWAHLVMSKYICFPHLLLCWYEEAYLISGRELWLLIQLRVWFTQSFTFFISRFEA